MMLVYEENMLIMLVFWMSSRSINEKKLSKRHFCGASVTACTLMASFLLGLRIKKQQRVTQSFTATQIKLTWLQMIFSRIIASTYLKGDFALIDFFIYLPHSYFESNIFYSSIDTGSLGFAKAFQTSLHGETYTRAEKRDIERVYSSKSPIQRSLSCPSRSLVNPASSCDIPGRYVDSLEWLVRITKTRHNPRRNRLHFSFSIIWTTSTREKDLSRQISSRRFVSLSRSGNRYTIRDYKSRD